MSLTDFLDALFTHGAVTVPLCKKAADARRDPADEAACAELLTTLERRWRVELPGTPPDFVPELAVQGLRQMYVAAIAIVSRELDEVALNQIWVAPVPTREASAHYSTDFTLRFLPSVMKLARRLAAEDPLVGKLLALAHAWPLSSIGIPGVEAGKLELAGIWENPSLRQLYIDRVVERRDLTRLADPRVAAGVQTALGAHERLWPDAAAPLPAMLPALTE